MAVPKSPVVPGLEPFEQILGADQPEYIPLPILRGRGPIYNVFSRWTLTPEERKLIAAGGDLIIGQMTFGHLFQPTFIQAVSNAVSSEVETEACIEALGLKDELDERISKVFLDNKHPFG